MRHCYTTTSQNVFSIPLRHISRHIIEICPGIGDVTGEIITKNESVAFSKFLTVDTNRERWIALGMPLFNITRLGKADDDGL